MNTEIHVFHRMNYNIDKLHTRNHKFNMKYFIVDKIIHQRLESPSLMTDLFKVIES